MSDVRIGATNSIVAVDNWLKALAGNLTGSTVNGYRQTKVLFQDVLVETMRAGARATTTPAVADINPIQFGTSGTAISATRTDFSQGALNGTQRPSDLAITGNGFFVLSKVKNPDKLTDLVFTRDGAFTFDLEPDSSVLADADKAKLGPNSQIGVLRLVSQEGLYVMGMTGDYQPALNPGLPGTPLTLPEGAARSNSLGNMISEPARIMPAGVNGPNGSAGAGGLGLKPFTYPFIKDSNGSFSLNDDLLGKYNFNRNGMLLNTDKQDVPDSTTDFEATGVLTLGDAGAAGTGQGVVNNRTRYNKYVALASFSSPDGLFREAGTAFTWQPTAETAFFGIGGTNTGTVGAANEISAGNLETSNSSVNTALPELTIAQKSFTANVKIVSVGNTLVDDVNQLIR